MKALFVTFSILIACQSVVAQIKTPDRNASERNQLITAAELVGQKQQELNQLLVKFTESHSDVVKVRAELDMLYMKYWNDRSLGQYMMTNLGLPRSPSEVLMRVLVIQNEQIIGLLKKKQ